MDVLKNKFRGIGMTTSEMADTPYPSQEVAGPQTWVGRIGKDTPTPLFRNDDLAKACNVGAVFLKDERERMGLGSFKALGAAYVVACDAENGKAAGQTYVTASAGNHGLSVAFGAAACGAHSVIYLSMTVPEPFADRLRALGAEVVRAGDTYEASMDAALNAAQMEGWILLSDSSWPGYMERPHRLMEGYLVLMQEAVDAMDTAPTHVFLQAGVGGLATACATLIRALWGDAPRIVVVEPDVAPALIASIKAGKSIDTSGPVSAMGRLDCKTPSLIALKGLARDADFFVTISEREGHAGAAACAALGLATTPSGAAGVAALIASGAVRDALGLTPTSSVLAILSEGPEA